MRDQVAGSAVTVGTDYTELMQRDFGGMAAMANIEVHNAAGGSALSGFKVQLKAHPEGEWYDYLEGADFDSTTNTNMLFATSTGPHELGADARAQCIIRITAAHAVRLLAKVASSTATVTARMTAILGVA